MKKLLLFFILLSGVCFGQMSEYKIIDSIFEANYYDIQKEKLNDIKLANLTELRDNFLLKSGRFILDKKPIIEFFDLIPVEFRYIYSDTKFSSYQELEAARYEIDKLYKSQIINAFLEYQNDIEGWKLDQAKDRLVNCLIKDGIEIITFQNMTKMEKLPIQKKCFPELHQK